MSQTTLISVVILASLNCHLTHFYTHLASLPGPLAHAPCHFSPQKLITIMPKSSRPPRLSLQQIEVIDLSRVIRLEASSYPSDEAASGLDLEYRTIAAKHLCYIAFLDGVKDFIGFVVATAAPNDTRTITEGIMRSHDAFGNVLCIHSVVIDAPYRRQGLGTAMMTAYLKQIRHHTNMKKVLLLSKRHLIPFYERHGFRLVGASRISHGKDTWYDMALEL